MNNNHNYDWEKCYDDNDNTYWETSSSLGYDEGCPFTLRIKKMLMADEVIWFDDSDQEVRYAADNLNLEEIKAEIEANDSKNFVDAVKEYREWNSENYL